MLPPGHIAAGFLTAEVLLHVVHPQLSSIQQNQLLWWGMFFGFAPDLDTFIAFAKEKAFIITNPKNSHRKIFTHAPLLWMLAGLALMLFAGSLYWKWVGLLLWAGSWSHFFLDTIQYGIMWLWPFSSRIYAFTDKELNFNIKEHGFFGYWLKFLKSYSKQISFYLEVLIILTALIIYFK